MLSRMRRRSSGVGTASRARCYVPALRCQHSTHTTRSPAIAETGEAAALALNTSAQGRPDTIRGIPTEGSSEYSVGSGQSRGNRAPVEPAVALDLCDTFYAAIAEVIPESWNKIVYDRFHVMPPGMDEA